MTDRHAPDVVPEELDTRLRSSKDARAAWDALPPSHRREHIGYVSEAKKPETRERRADATIARLLDT